jgi:hypothetical protein
MKKLVATVALAVALSLTLAVSASANAPTSVTEQLHLVTNPYITCSGFVVVGDFYVARTTTTFYDNDGNAISRVQHIHVDGKLSNSLTGASLDFLREGTFTQNLVDGSTVTTGQRTLVTTPGGGVVLQDMGRIVRERGVIVFEAGPSDFLNYQSGDRSGVEDLCAALAD